MCFFFRFHPDGRPCLVYTSQHFKSRDQLAKERLFLLTNYSLGNYVLDTMSPNTDKQR